MLGLVGATALVTGGMIGAGILILPAIMAVFGSWSIVGWILATFMAYSIATVFGRLSKTFKGGSGPMQYIGDTFGSKYGFLSAWGYFFALCFSGAGIALALGNYALPLIGCDCIPAWAIGVIVTLLLFILNIVSSGSANTLLIVLTILKVLFFVVIALVGFKNIGSYHINFGPVTDMFKSGSLAMFAFLGLEFASVSSASIKDPAKNVMRATKLGLAIAALVFIGVHCAVLFALPDAASSNRPVYDTAYMLFGSLGAIMFGVIAVISCLSTLNGIIVVQANNTSAVAERGWLNKSLAKKTKQGFAWKGALAFWFMSFLIIVNPILDKNTVCIMANSLVGIVYLLSTLVDVKKLGWDIHNIMALVSSLLILYNVNLLVFMLIVGIYSIGYCIKMLNEVKLRKGK